MSKKFARQDKSQPKHHHYSSTAPITRSTAIVAANPSRPEWRGTGLHKPAKKATRPKDGAVASKAQREKELLIECKVEPGLQQKLLDVLRGAFPDACMRGYEELRPALTAVKASLDAGGSKVEEGGVWDAEMREAFTLRWGAERALLLSALLVMWAQEKFREEIVFNRLRKGVETLDIVCFGTGVAEILALALLLRQERFGGEAGRVEENDRGKVAPVTLHTVQQSTKWAAEIESLNRALQTPPVLSKYASAAAKAAARPFLEADSLAYFLHCCKVPEELDSAGDLTVLLRERPSLIMLCFSLREMQRSSVPKAVRFLMALTKEAAKNTLLLIVDQVEGTNDEAVDSGEKSYPLSFILDLALLGRGVVEDKEEKADEAEGNEEAAGPETAWERLVGDEERIFKTDQGLQYPLSLGKIGAQVHLFKKR